MYIVNFDKSKTHIPFLFNNILSIHSLFFNFFQFLYFSNSFNKMLIIVEITFRNCWINYVLRHFNELISRRCFTTRKLVKRVRIFPVYTRIWYNTTFNSYYIHIRNFDNAIAPIRLCFCEFIYLTTFPTKSKNIQKASADPLYFSLKPVHELAHCQHELQSWSLRHITSNMVLLFLNLTFKAPSFSSQFTLI